MPSTNIPPLMGRLAPDFSLPSTLGTKESLSAYRGRPVLVVFLRHLG